MKQKRKFCEFSCDIHSKSKCSLNPCDATGLFPNSVKASENLWFPDVFRGPRERPVVTSQNKFFFLSNTYTCFKALVGLSRSKAKRWENNKPFYYIENVILVWTSLFSAGDTLKLKCCSKRVYFVITILYLNI